jgi:hypothetical protein
MNSARRTVLLRLVWGYLRQEETGEDDAAAESYSQVCPRLSGWSPPLLVLKAFQFSF